MTLNWLIIILCAVGISILLTVLVIPQILHVSLEKRLFDRPNSRKVHNGIVPRLGGFGFLPVILLTMGIMLVIPAAYSDDGAPSHSPEFIFFLPDIIVLIAAMVIMFMTGLFDDLVGLKYTVKFLAQFLAAVLIVEAGEYICNYDTLFGITLTGSVIGKIITGFLIIYIINALNLIDGIDGLASGLCMTTLGFFGVAFYAEGLYLFSLLSWVCVGTLGVFWLFNVFGSKRRHTKIFMGDVGSLSIGVLVAFLCIMLGKQAPGASAWGIAPLVLALSPLVLPLFDVIRVFFIRLINGNSPFLPDKRHIHHLMLNTGLSMKSVMVILILIQSGMVAINLWISYFANINLILIVDVVIYSLGVMIITTPKKTERKR